MRRRPAVAVRGRRSVLGSMALHAVMTVPVVVLAAALPLAAQEVARDTTKKGEAVRIAPVTVTATRGAASELATPLAITTVGTAELRGVSGFGLDDALAQVPGVLAQSRYGTSDVRIVIRGFGARGAGDRSNGGTSRGIRVLVDGFPETEPDGRTAFDQIDLAAARSVEVIRSNASSVWGNAAGGVVSIRTAPTPGETGVEAQSMVGSFGLQRHAVRASGSLGTGAAYATFTNTSFEGWRDHSSARRALLGLGATGVIGARTRIGVHGTATNNLLHLPGPLTRVEARDNPRQANATYAARDERRYNRIARLGATVEHSITNETSVSALLFVNPKFLQRSERNTFRDFTRYHLGASLVARAEIGISEAVRMRLMAGADEAYQDGATLFYSLTPGGGRGNILTENKGEGANSAGVFVQNELLLCERVALTIGARYDQVAYRYRSFLPAPPVRSDSRRFSRVTPKIAASMLLGSNRSVYASVGGGIEVPAGNETDPTPGSPPALLNPLLDPIRSTTYEVGMKSLAQSQQAAGDRPIALSYDVALYSTGIVDDIVPYAGGRYYLTAGRARRTGAELGVRAMLRSGAFVSGAFTASRNRYLEYVIDSTLLGGSGRADYSGNSAVGIPGRIANAEVGAPIAGAGLVRVKFGVEHTGAYYADDANSVRVGSFTVADATAEVARPIGIGAGWGISGFLTVRNLTDLRYTGSAFLNPDRVNGEAVAFEPGMPRSIVVSLTIGRL